MLILMFLITMIILGINLFIIKNMIQSDKTALHYEVIANTAHKIEKVAKELSTLYKDSYFNVSKANLRKSTFERYIKELEELIKQ